MDTLKWAFDCFGEADLGDSRRTARLVEMASMIATSPECSLSSAMGNEARNKAAQRFFESESFGYGDIISSAVEQTVEKISKSSEQVLLIQDSCHLNYDTKTATLGLGHIGSTDDRSFQGVMMHWCLAVTRQGNCLGLAHLHLWERPKDPRKKKIGEHQNKPISSKESFKWLETVDSLDGHIPISNEVVWVSDRESDIYEFIDKVISKDQKFVIRANNDRVIADEEKLLKERVKSTPILGLQTLEKSNRQGKKISVKVEIRCAEIGLVAQRRKGGAKTPQKCLDHEIYAVNVCSADPNHDFEWTLLTNMRTETLEEALNIVGIYKERWHIESVHKTLKSGFQAEKLSLGDSDKIEKAIALLLPCAVQVYWMAHMQKHAPDKPANILLSNTEYKLLNIQNKKPKDHIPTIKEAWLWIGYMGGFRGSKNSKPPGQITFWRGLRKLKDMALGVELMEKS